MNLPRGELLRSRVVADVGRALAAALDRELTGYVVLEPQEALLLDGGEPAVITFEGGIPVLAYHTGSDRGGPPALADAATPGPYGVDLYAVDRSAFEGISVAEALRVPPGMPAERLADDPDLAARTREAAPAGRVREPPDRAGTADAPDRHGAVESFLADTEKIEAIREQAREEARQRAADWGLTDALDDPDGRDA